MANVQSALAYVRAQVKISLLASETTTSFFLLLQALIVYHMHAKYMCIICTPKSISAYKLHAK